MECEGEAKVAVQPRVAEVGVGPHLAEHSKVIEEDDEALGLQVHVEFRGIDGDFEVVVLEAVRDGADGYDGDVATD